MRVTIMLMSGGELAASPGVLHVRHTYASHLMMRGAKPVEVQELLGHASLTMTTRYTHLSPGARRAAAKLLDAAPPRHHGGTGDSPEDRT